MAEEIKVNIAFGLLIVKGTVYFDDVEVLSIRVKQDPTALMWATKLASIMTATEAQKQ